MGIFDFFKGKKKQEEIIETISFTEISKWVDNKKQLVLGNCKGPKHEINELVLKVVGEFEDSVEVLKNLDLTDKKAPERAKLIVQQNLDNFVDYLEKLVLGLRGLVTTDLNSSEDLETLINKINSSFADFEKKSIMSFQKSTFLIGEELGKVKMSISGFFKSFNKIINENKDLMEKMKCVFVIGKKLKEIDYFEKVDSENKAVVLRIREEIEVFEEKIRKIEDKIKEVKEGEEYNEQMKNREEIERLRRLLVGEFQALKDLTDFKALSKVYHSIEDKMNLIKYYQENFKEAFEKHGVERFLELINIREIKQDRVKEKIKSIEEIKEGIEEIGSKIEKDLTEDLKKEVEGIGWNITELHLEMMKKEKLKKKFVESQEQVKEEIIEQAKILNLVVE